MKKLFIPFDDEYDYSLIGITTHEKDYRLCWLINKHLNLNFERIEDIEICHRKTETTTSYSVYECPIEAELLSFYIISNSKMKEHLLSEVKHANYLFMIKGEYDESEKESLILKLKSVKNIMLAFNIDMESIDTISKQNLMF